MQVLQVIGSLGADAKIVDNNGKPFISFNVADTERWTDEAGEKHERTSWIQCAYNGDTKTPIFAYLKKGTKVYVSGRQRTRVYSSEKERRMVAGVSLSVNHIELVGGNNDDVPRRLINPDTAELIPVYKAYYIAQTDLPRLSGRSSLVDNSGNAYNVAPEGWVTANQPQPQQQQQVEAEPAETTTGQATDVANDAPFTGDDTELQQKTSTKRTKK